LWTAGKPQEQKKNEPNGVKADKPYMARGGEEAQDKKEKRRGDKGNQGLKTFWIKKKKGQCSEKKRQG